MPTYEYECVSGGHRFERFQSFSEPAIEICPECGGQVRRVLFAAPVIFKGPGFFRTESRKNSDGSGESNKDKSESSNGSSESED